MRTLLPLAQQLGVAVTVTGLPDEMLGCWIPEMARVFIDWRLTPFEQRYVLAHELGHVHHEHLCGDDVPPDRIKRQERQADVYAVRALIDPAEYARIEAVNPDKHHIADELGLPVEAIHVYESSCLTKLAGVTYALPRDGLGQWAHMEHVA